MPADFTIVEGDSAPTLNDTLTTADGKPAALEGATIELVLRTPTSSEPIVLVGAVAVTNLDAAHVSYAFAAADTLGRAGMYLASWRVTFADGTPMTFPTRGYLWVEIQASLATAGEPTIVGLGEVKDHLNIPAGERMHDSTLERFIKGVRPLIENKTGPILPQRYEEWHDGGNTYLMLRRRPSTGMGTTPVITLIACSEYAGPIEWPLKIVASPDKGELYSCELDVKQARVVRRSAGGGVQPFPYGPRAVRVKYEAGQAEVPENVNMAAVETIAWWWRTTQRTGGGRRTSADAETEGRPLVALPYHAEAMLAPQRRHPSIG